MPPDACENPKMVFHFIFDTIRQSPCLNLFQLEIEKNGLTTDENRNNVLGALVK